MDRHTSSNSFVWIVPSADFTLPTSAVPSSKTDMMMARDLGVDTANCWPPKPHRDPQNAVASVSPSCCTVLSLPPTWIGGLECSRSDGQEKHSLPTGRSRQAGAAHATALSLLALEVIKRKMWCNARGQPTGARNYVRS